jgi:hypothetical protein
MVFVGLEILVVHTFHTSLQSPGSAHFGWLERSPWPGCGDKEVRCDGRDRACERAGLLGLWTMGDGSMVCAFVLGCVESVLY